MINQTACFKFHKRWDLEEWKYFYNEAFGARYKNTYGNHDGQLYFPCNWLTGNKTEQSIRLHWHSVSTRYTHDTLAGKVHEWQHILMK
jgi:hypothetical protein